jgi:alpha-L-rhamnosidase
MLEGEQQVRTAQNLLGDRSLTRATIYFTHYLFETYRLLEQPAALFARLGLWFDLPAQGFKTTPEQPEPSRSDCHGWGAHPLYHFFATLLGVRPAAPGFEQVEIKPMPGDLTELAGEMVHPRGQIAVELHFMSGRVRGNVVLPEGLQGTFCYGGKTVGLRPGTQALDL